MRKALTGTLLFAVILMTMGFAANTIYRGKPVHVAKVRIVHMTDEEAWKLLDSVEWPK